MAASKRMMRDFGEVENLQVTRKGSADFVSQADISAERIIQAELAKARPDWGFIMEEAGQIDAAIKMHPAGSLTRLTAPQTSCMDSPFCDLYCGYGQR